MVAQSPRVVFEWVRELNRALAAHELMPEQAAAALAAWVQMDTIFGIGAKADTEMPAELLVLLDDRNAARKAKDFKRADSIRDELKSQGWVIDDTPTGARLKKL